MVGTKKTGGLVILVLVGTRIAQDKNSYPDLRRQLAVAQEKLARADARAPA